MREFLKKGAQLAAGPALGQLLAFAALPIIARLYSADQFGTFSVFIVFCNALGAISTLSIERTLFHVKDRLLRLNLLFVAFLAVLVIAASAIALLPLYGATFSMDLNVAVGSHFALLGGAIVVARGLYQISFIEALSAQSYAAVSWAGLLKDVARVSSRIGLGVSALNPLGLYLSAFVDWLAGAVFLVVSSHINPVRRSSSFWRRAFRARTIAGARRTIARHYELLVYLAPANLLSVVAPQLPLLAMASFTDAEYVGIYAMAFLVLDRPTRIFAKSAGELFVSLVLRSRGGASSWIRIFSVQVCIAAVGIFAACVLLAGLGQKIFGEEWAGIGMISFAAAPHVLALFLGEVTLASLAFGGKSRWILMRQSLSIAVMSLLGFSILLIFDRALVAVAAMGTGHLLVQGIFAVKLRSGTKSNV